jgi:LmbE family N-acetylglucosaminyl deacetylase
MTGSRLLAVMAHPDDESFGPGGSLAAAVADGIEVHLATMTDGAAGTTDDDLAPEVLAELRAEELRKAAAVLGVTLHHLRHRDSGFHDPVTGAHPEALINVPEDRLVDELQRLIQEIRPDVVMTHDETGGYGHPDHVRCHEITLAAMRTAAPWKPARLYCDAISDRWVKIAVKVMRLARRDPTRLGANNDVDLTKIGVPAASITTRIDIRGHWATKKAAGACHRSQQGAGPPLVRYLPVWMLRLLFPAETFVRVLPPGPGPVAETSFFEGL